MNLQPIIRAAVCAALVAVCLAGAGWFPTQPVSGQETGPRDQQIYRPGLRNSFLGHQLSATELNLVLAHLRRKTGFTRMRFDEAGFLTIDDRSQIDGGSAAARELLLAAVDGKKSINLQSHNRSPEVVFARVSEAVKFTGWRSEARIAAAQIEIDFADFNHLRGPRKAMEAFDPGFVILHELSHAALGLRDPSAAVNAAGDCESYINRIRRELGMPERRQYAATVYRKATFSSGSIARIAELIFAQTEPGPEPGSRAKTKKLRLRWNVQQVGKIRWLSVSPAAKEKTSAGVTAALTLLARGRGRSKKMKRNRNMRYLLFKPTFFIVIILSAALYFQRAELSAGAASALPPLTGEAAVNHLKEQGLYSSLIQAAGAARAARHDARPLPAHFEPAAGAEDREAASSPESSLAINLPFTQLLRQTARDGAANDSYGWSVAASDDTIVVGAYLDTVGTNARQGSAYVFSRSGGDWTFQQKLTANDGEAEERFGSSVAISGDTIVAGAPLDRTGTNYYHGSAYVFARSGGVWSFQQKLTAHDGAAYDQFGSSVAISGGTVVAGAFSDDIGTKGDQGSVYVFVRSSGVWSFQQKLVANDGEANDQFGAAVAISGGTVIAGAILDDLGASKDAGSAYVFTRSGAVWTQQQRLVMAGGVRTSDLFGAAVAISGDTALIGAPLYDTSGVVDRGLAAVFVRSGSVWSYQGALAANDGAESDQFGSSVAINGDTALIGAHFDDVGTATGTALDQGSAYLFTRSSGTLWGARQKFTAQGGAARDLFGQAVALSGDKAIVGAPHAKVGDNAAQGALYLYGCGYLEQPQFSGVGGAKNDKFGGVVALDGDTAVVGAPDYRVGTNYFQGSAYIFARSGANWRQVAQLFAPEGKERDRFGYSVAISGDTIVVGAPGYDTADLVDCGAAFFYFRSGGIWTLTTRAFGFAREDHFGRSVAASGSLIAISSPYNDVGGIQDAGAVFLFRRTGASLSNEGRLNANDGAARDFFGSSVAVSGDRMLVGAPGPNEGERSKGAAYVFERSSTSSPAWRQHAKLLADDGELFDHLGDSVALSGNTALVSAPGKSNNTTLPVKAAYVFVGPGAAGGNWSQQARLLLGGGSPTAPLAVALSGNTAVVGSSAEPVDGRFPGTAHVFTRSGAVWSLQQQLLASNGEQGHRFGAAVALSGDTIMVGAPGAGNVNQGAIYVLKKSCGAPLARLASVSAASFDAAAGLAPESITAVFGVNLGAETQAAVSLPLPTTLAGVSLKITDSAGAERLAPLFFVSPGQINYVIPAGTANGPATLTVMNAGEPVASGEARIASAAPGLFSANSSGEGVAAALALRVKADGSQSFEPVAQFDPTQNRFVPAPIDLGPAADQVFLVFYGTGLRFRSSLSAVSCAIGGVDSEALFAGAAPGFAGLDQVNVRLPRSLAGRGEVDVELFVDGEAANAVRVSIR